MNERTHIRSLIGNGEAMTRTLIAAAAGRSARGPDDGIGLDEYVDWLIQAGYPIERIGDFGEWLRRFETGLRRKTSRKSRRRSSSGTSPICNCSACFRLRQPMTARRGAA
jgi:thioester reductase-like protein